MKKNDILIPMTVDELADNFKNLEFKYIYDYQQFDHPFFKELSNLYNEEPILFKCVCSDKKLFSQCVENLAHIDKLGNSKESLTNQIIKGLLTNKFLNAKPSPIREFSDNANWERFGKISINSISPLAFEGKLAELVSKGGLFFKSDKSLKDIVVLARGFSDSILQGQLTSFIIYQIEEGWSAYHGNMGYDNAFILFDEDQGGFWILSNTDYD